MEKFLKIIFFSLILAHLQQSEAGVVLKNVGKVAYQAMQELASYFNFLGDPIYVLELFQAFTGASMTDPNQINAALDDISVKIDELSQNMLRFEREVLQKIDTLKEHTEMTNKLRDIYKNVDRINYFYDRGYVNFIKDSKVYLNDTKVNFARKVLSFDDDGVNYSLETIHMLLGETDTTGKSLPMYYAENDDLSRSLVCRKKQSAQKLIYNIYELIAVTEMKGIILLTYAYEFLLGLENDPQIETSELSDARYHQKKRMKNTFETIKKIAESASREIWPCDPSNYEIGVTYENFGPIFQKYVMYEGDIYNAPEFNEIDTSVYAPEGGYGSYVSSSIRFSTLCKSDCPSINYADKLYCNSDLCKRTPDRFVCNGQIHNCEYVDTYMYLCLAEQSNNRLYQSIKTDDGRTFGDGRTCPNTELEAHSHYGIGTFYNCDYCLCTCEQSSKKDVKKYVNLKPVFSDVYDNKVLTGVQLINVKNIFHIKIQQGTLLPKGRIDSKTVEWKDVSAYDIFNESYKLGSDFHEITWDHRTFLLDELGSYDGHVLGGIQFMLDENKNVKLAIYSLPFDLEFGQLNVDEGVWLDSSSFDETSEREELVPEKYGLPTNFPKHEPDSQSNQFIKLTTSDLYQDVGQTVVPFFDAQPLTSSYPMPFSGAALIHKGHEGSAGFLALKLFTYDINELTSN